MTSRSTIFPPAEMAIPSTYADTAAGGKISRTTALLCVLVLAAICFTFHLGTGPLAGTEGHRAITAEQMLQNGNYLLPRLYGHIYLAKPPLPYWLIALSEKCFGPGEWVWRFPSALASVLLAVGICAVTARWFDALAGLAAGMAFIGLIPLWSQDRSADVDAINHLGSVLAALAMIDITLRLGRTARWAFWLAVLGTAMACMSKGPAGLTVILGAAIGSALANRDLRLLRRPGIYLVVLLGITPLALWGALAYSHLGHQAASADINGATEIQSRLLMLLNFRNLPLILSLPILVLAYGMPVSALLLVPVVPGLRNGFDLNARRLIRGICGAVIAALVIQMCTGMINPRYAFLDLPLLCPLAGALVFVRHRFSRKTVTGWLTFVSVAYCSTAGIIIYLERRIGFHSHLDWLIGLLVFLMIMAVIAAIIGKSKWCALVACSVICASALVYGLYKSAEESLRSAKPQAGALAAYIPPGIPIIAWNALYSQPELFYYAHLHPEMAHPLPGWKIPSPAWLVLDDEEWNDWQDSPQYAADLSRVKVLRPYKHVVYVCWYSK